MDVKMFLVVILLSVIATHNVLASVSGTECPNGNDDCKSIVYAECKTVPSPLVCTCKDGYKESDKDECQPELDSVCTTSDKCTDANAACTDTDSDGNGGTCKCSSGFKDNPCVAKAVSDNECTNDGTECNGIANAECDKTVGVLKCKCKDGFTENSNVCQAESGAASTKAIIWILFSSLLILLVNKLMM